jgi:hypothetical protein
MDWAGHALPSVSFFSSKSYTPGLRPTHGILCGIGMMNMLCRDMGSTLRKRYLRLNNWLHKNSG